jgi:superfamily II DNA helicase RecQ
MSFPIFEEFYEFQESHAFQEFPELSFLSYYSDFKLVICSSCKIGINNSNISSHFKSDHFSSYSKEEKIRLKEATINLLMSLDIQSLDASTQLIYKFFREFNLFGLSFLPTHESVYSCSICTYTLLNKTNLVRHLKTHLNNDSSILVNKGQSLERTRFFFPIKVKEKSLVTQNNSSGEEEEVEEEDNDLLKASALFKQDLLDKEKELDQELNSFTFDKSEKLTTFQVRTRYPEFVSKYNSEELRELCRTPVEEEIGLEILVLNLKELLYLSLDKALYLPKVALNSLNSFEEDRTKQKGFKPLLKSASRLKYFGLFSTFICFIWRSYISQKHLGEKRLFYLPDISVQFLNKLESLLSLKEAENHNFRSLKLTLKDIQKKSNKRLTQGIISNLPVYRSLEDDSEDGSSVSGNSSSNSSESSSSSSSNNSIINDPSASDISILERIKDINESSDLLSTQIKQCLLGLLISVFKQDINLDIFDSSINSFFACRSLRANNTLRDSFDLSQYYSMFIYCAQVVVIEYCFRILLNNTEESMLQLIKDFMKAYFTNNKATGLAEILSNRLLAVKINKESSGTSSVLVSSLEENTISYKKLTISVDNISLLFNDLVSMTDNFLREKLLFSLCSSEYNSLLLEDFSQVEDNWDSTPFKCFKDFHPNVSKNDVILLNIVMGNKRLLHEFFSFKNSKLVARQNKIKEYFDDLTEFLKLCSVLVYFTSGLPLRGTELVTLRYLNSFKDCRELFLDKSSNLFVLKISYWKGLQNTEKLASSIRFLPKSVSQIILVYIVIATPFIKKLNILRKKSTDNNLRLSPYLFYNHKRLITSQDISIKISSLSSLILGQRLSIQSYRQIIVGIIRSFMHIPLSSDYLALEEEREDEDSPSSIKANLMNHSIATEELHYGRSKVIFSNIRGNLQIKYLQFCLEYFKFFSLNNIDFNHESFENTLSIRESIRTMTQDSFNNSLALRFSKSKEVSPALSQELFRSNSRKHSRQASSISTSVLQADRVKRVLVKDLLHISTSILGNRVLNDLLKEFLDDSEAAYKTEEQALLVKAILLKVPYILAVLPTNSGKSLSYLLTSSLSTSKVTLVILPLVALKKDIKRRSLEFNIPISQWEHSQEFKSLTLISLDTIENPKFTESISNLINNHLLDRIILDEFHLLYTTSSYRFIMFRFKNILPKPVQFVFLTGTLPLHIQVSITESLLLDNISIIRANCCRNNISYQTQQFQSTRLEDRFLEIKAYLDSSKSTFISIKDKVIIFCRNKNIVNDLSTFLDCCYYSSDLSEEEKEAVLEKFTTSTGNFFYDYIVSTSGLEEGFDYSNIRLVIYFELGHSFIGFIQGSGRGGRDNNLSRSVLFHKSSDLKSSIDDSEDTVLFNKYLNEQVCRRKTIDYYIDNHIVDTCSHSQELCDLCLERRNIHINQAGRLSKLNRVTESNRIKFKSLLGVWGRQCIFCYVIDELDVDHASSHCAKYQELEVQAKGIANNSHKKMYSLSEDSCCFKCLLPTVICSSLKIDNKCFNRKIMMRVIAISWFQRETWWSDISCNISLDNFVEKYFIKKVFNQDLDTKVLLGISVLFNLYKELRA